MFLNIILYLVIFLVIIYLLGELYSYKFRSSIKHSTTKKIIPGGSVWGLFRLALQGSKLSRKDFFLNQRKKYGDVYTFFLLHMPQVDICDHVVAKEFLRNTKISEKVFLDFNVKVSKFLGKQQVVSSNGKKWKKQRSILDPAFYKLENYFDIFNDKAKKSIDVMVKDAKESNGEISNVLSYTQKITLDVLGLSVFGHDFESIEGKFSKSLHSYDTLMENLFDIKFVIFPFLTRLPWLSYNIKMDKAIDIMDKLVYSLVDKSKKKLKSGKPPTTMLDSMVFNSNLIQNKQEEEEEEEEAEKLMTMKEIRDNVMIFFLAGHDTTSSSLAFGLYRLAKHQTIQEKIRKEMQSIFQTSDDLDYSKFSKMEYTLSFIKEVLRYHAPVLQIPGRRLTKSTKLGSYKIPKGTLVTVNAAAIHFDKKVYGDPFAFRPERWLDKSKKIPPSAWIPFSAGNRVCMGNTFSLLEQKIYYTKLLMNYKLKLKDGNYTPIEDPTAQFVSKPIASTLIIEKL